MKLILQLAWLLLSAIPIILSWVKEEKKSFVILILIPLINFMSLFMVYLKITNIYDYSFIFAFLFPIYAILHLLLSMWTFIKRFNKIRTICLGFVSFISAVCLFIKPLEYAERFDFYIDKYNNVANDLLSGTALPDHGSQITFPEQAKEYDIRQYLSEDAYDSYQIIIDENSVRQVIWDKNFVFFLVSASFFTSVEYSGLAIARDGTSISDIQLIDAEIEFVEQIDDNAYYFKVLDL